MSITRKFGLFIIPVVGEEKKIFILKYFEINFKSCYATNLTQQEIDVA
jgi:hypothetical protein